ncbi:hypothetical protein SEA_CAMERICO_3 [Gordonia phage Camerico]|nr:hypothetical protein SEA_CAMERICO_3 [Gordonia phage Camerico]
MTRAKPYIRKERNGGPRLTDDTWIVCHNKTCDSLVQISDDRIDTWLYQPNYKDETGNTGFLFCSDECRNEWEKTATEFEKIGLGSKIIESDPDRLTQIMADDQEDFEAEMTTLDTGGQ